MIWKCTCADEYCDKLYGNGMRVFNDMKAGGGRCSTCGREDSSASSKKKEEVKTEIPKKAEKVEKNAK